MKKMLFSLSVLLASTYALATVESQVVGYETGATAGSNKFEMRAVPFSTVTDMTSIPLNGAFNATFSEGDTIQFLTPTGYETYEYYMQAYADENYDEATAQPGWADGAQIYTDVTIPLGVGFWLKSASPISITMKGSVVAESVNAETPANRFTIVAGAFPVTVKLNDLTWPGLQEGDSIQFLTPTGYETYEYYMQAYADENYDEATAQPGWADGGQIYTDKEIQSGASFWVKTASTTTVTFESPVK